MAVHSTCWVWRRGSFYTWFRNCFLILCMSYKCLTFLMQHCKLWVILHSQTWIRSTFGTKMSYGESQKNMWITTSNHRTVIPDFKRAVGVGRAEESEPTRKAFPPFNPGVTDRVWRLLRTHYIRTFYKPNTKILLLNFTVRDLFCFRGNGIKKSFSLSLS